jgi:hypothetical protein
MALLYICHKRRSSTGRQSSSLRKAIAAIGQQQVRCICDQKEANDTGTKIEDISFAEIELWDKQKKIQVEKPYEKEVKSKFVKGIRIKLKPIYRLVRRK